MNEINNENVVDDKNTIISIINVIKAINASDVQMFIDDNTNKYVIEHKKKYDTPVWNCNIVTRRNRYKYVKQCYTTLVRYKQLRNKSARIIQRKYLERYYSSNNENVLKMKETYFNLL
ncbi:hypothetical protein CCP3SC1AL1_1380003 [Gammaproteobacteria bacterium]